MQMPSSLAVGISDFLKEVRPSHVIETGTYEGLGSTKIIAELLTQLKCADQFVTVEANWKSWKKAKRNLQPYSFVKPLWGNTVDVKHASAFIMDDEVLKHPENYPDLLFDTPYNQQQFYLDEINGKLGGRVSKRNMLAYLMDRSLHFSGSNLLTKYLQKFRGHEPLIVLDSAGGIGWLEFQIVRETLGNQSYHILLDDINHVKHFRSYQAIQKDPCFHITSIDPDGRWVIASYVS